MTLTKADLATMLVEKYQFNKKMAKLYVDAFFDEIINAILSEGAVKLSGFGRFTTRIKESRPGRNPKTGEFAKVSARKVVTFKAGQKLKGVIEGSQDLDSLNELDGDR
jgi:integration host factor subunit alpha